MIDSKGVKRLIGYHEGILFQHRLYLSPDVRVLEEQTIEALKELKEIQGGKLIHLIPSGPPQNES